MAMATVGFDHSLSIDDDQGPVHRAEFITFNCPAVGDNFGIRF
jgi:hypothetical protein